MGFGQDGTRSHRRSTIQCVLAVAVQPDGKILVAGFVTGNGDGDAVVYG